MQPVREAERFFYFWDCITLDAAAKGERLNAPTVGAFVRHLCAEHALTLVSLRKLAWLLIVVAAPRPVTLRYLRERMNPWTCRRVKHSPAPKAG